MKVLGQSDSESENEDEIDPISIAVNAGASLSSPESALITRKRKVPINKGKYKRRGSTKTTNVSAWDCLKEYPRQHLAVVNGKLRCNTCSEVLTDKKSSIERLMKSMKHKRGLVDIERNKSEQQSIKECLQKKAERESASGSTLSLDIQLCRYELVESCLSGGVALSKVDAMRPFLEKYGHRRTSNAHLGEVIPAVLEKEKETLKEELKVAAEASVIFDGTARLSEALAIVVRYIQEDFKPTQRLVRLEVLAKTLKGDELAQRLMSCMAVDNKFGPGVIIGAMRDGAAVNGAALKQPKFFYAELLDVVCFSHTLDNVDSHFEFQVLDSFTRFWIGFFSHSYNARLLRKEKTGQSIRTHSDTRWWNTWEVLKQMFDLFGDVEPFLRENEEICPANRQHLLEIFDNPKNLRLELAALIDAGVHFVNATYYLVRNGTLIFSCYERLSAVAQAVAVDHYPNTNAVAREVANDDVAIYNQLVRQAKACIRPELNFYQQKFSVQFRDTVRAFKAARLCCPVQVQALRPKSASLEELRNFPFVNNDATMANLAQELPLHIAAADGVNVACEEDKVCSQRYPSTLVCTC